MKEIARIRGTRRSLIASLYKMLEEESGDRKSRLFFVEQRESVISDPSDAGKSLIGVFERATE